MQKALRRRPGPAQAGQRRELTGHHESEQVEWLEMRQRRGKTWWQLRIKALHVPGAAGAPKSPVGAGAGALPNKPVGAGADCFREEACQTKPK